MDEIAVGQQVTIGDTAVYRTTEDRFGLTHHLSREGVNLDRDEIRKLAEAAGFEVSDP